MVPFGFVYCCSWPVDELEELQEETPEPMDGEGADNGGESEIDGATSSETIDSGSSSVCCDDCWSAELACWLRVISMKVSDCCCCCCCCCWLLPFDEEVWFVTGTGTGDRLFIGMKLWKKSPTDRGGDASEGGVHMDARWSKSSESCCCEVCWCWWCCWCWFAPTGLRTVCCSALANICEVLDDEGEDGEEEEGELGDGKDSIVEFKGLGSVKCDLPFLPLKGALRPIEWTKGDCISVTQLTQLIIDLSIDCWSLQRVYGCTQSGGYAKNSTVNKRPHSNTWNFNIFFDVTTEKTRKEALMISGSTTAAFGEIASRRESASHSTTFFFQYRPLIALELSSYLFHRQTLIYYLALPLSLALLFAYLLYSPQVFVCIFLMRSPVSPYCVCDFIASPRGSLLHGTD